MILSAVRGISTGAATPCEFEVFIRLTDDYWTEEKRSDFGIAAGDAVFGVGCIMYGVGIYHLVWLKNRTCLTIALDELEHSRVQPYCLVFSD